MLIRIRDSFIDSAEIAVVRRAADCTLPVLDITLHCGVSCFVEGSVEELEAALIDAGLLDNPNNDVQNLSDDEVNELEQLDAAGYRFLARDKDGKLYAYRNKPDYDGAHWTDPLCPQDPIWIDDRSDEPDDPLFDFIHEADASLTDIQQILPTYF